jgi:hypothetical protein
MKEDGHYKICPSIYHSNSHVAGCCVKRYAQMMPLVRREYGVPDLRILEEVRVIGSIRIWEAKHQDGVGKGSKEVKEFALVPLAPIVLPESK